MKEIIYNKRLIARMVIETETPLAIGSGEKDIKTDKLVVKDVNGMPYIPGSSLAGVLRHSIKDFNRPDSIFGFQKGDEGKGSRILFTDGVMLGEDGIALDGLQQIPNTAFYERSKEPVSYLKWNWYIHLWRMPKSLKMRKHSMPF